MSKIISGLLAVVAVIHLLPVSGVLGADRLSILYGIELNESNLEILMRHRAVLFGLLGVFIAYAACTPSVQLLAIIAGFVSVLSFLAISLFVGEYNEALQTVFLADIVALVALLFASIVYVVRHHKVGKALLSHRERGI